MADDVHELGVAHRREHVGAVDRVALDDLELLVVERPLLVEDLDRRVDLAHVVDERRRADLGDLAGTEPHRARDPFGVAGDAPAMPVGVRVADLEQAAEAFEQLDPHHAVRADRRSVSRAQLLDPPLGPQPAREAPEHEVRVDESARAVHALPDLRLGGGEGEREQDRTQHREERARESTRGHDQAGEHGRHHRHAERREERQRQVADDPARELVPRDPVTGGCAFTPPRPNRAPGTGSALPAERRAATGDRSPPVLLVPTSQEGLRRA